MRPQLPIGICAVLCLGLLASGTLAQKLYRWVDDEGNVHYGDRIPPEYANQDRDILNDQGVAVGREEGELTPEERAELARQEAAKAAAERERQERIRHDRMLLETYVSVADIEDLRDRRLELLASQIQVTELYLSNLRERLSALEKEASVYKPYSDDPDARQLPTNLAGEIEQTQQSIAAYEQRVTRTREEQKELRASFDADIARFKELKGS